jgi:tetratricopeptide (TPR) repeat protein
MRFAHREAAVWREQALRALGHLPDSPENRVEGIDLRMELRVSLLALGDLGELSRIPALLEEAARLAADLGDQRRLGLALTYLGGYAHEIAEAETALSYGERAMAIARDLGDPGLEIAAALVLGQTHFSVGSFGRAIELLGRNVATLETFRPAEDSFTMTPVSVISRCFLARALVEVGEFEKAAIRAKEVIAVSEADDHASGLANGLFALGVVHVRQGDIPRAISALERGVAIARSAVAFLVPVVNTALGHGLALTGRVRDCIALLEEAGRAARAAGRLGVEVAAHQMLAEAHILDGRLEEASAVAADALDTARRIRRRGMEAWVLRALGDISAAGTAPDLGEADRRYREALDLARQLGMRPLVAHCHLGLGKVSRRTGKRQEAEDHLAIATTMYQEMGMRFWLEQVEAARQELTG